MPLWTRCLRSGRPGAIKPDTIADGTTAPFDATHVRAAEGMRRPVADRAGAAPEISGSGALHGAKVVAEGAGALAFAALEQLEPGPRTVAMVSGGNIDPKLLASLIA